MKNSRIIDAIDFESDDKNWKYPFKKMCQKYGKDFIEMIKAMWEANGESQTEEEFCEMNGFTNQFFDKNIKSQEF